MQLYSNKKTNKGMGFHVTTWQLSTRQPLEILGYGLAKNIHIHKVLTTVLVYTIDQEFYSRRFTLRSEICSAQELIDPPLSRPTDPIIDSVPNLPTIKLLLWEQSVPIEDVWSHNVFFKSIWSLILMKKRWVANKFDQIFGHCVEMKGVLWK